MVEVLVSVGVLSIASLGVMGVLTYGLMAGDAAGNFSTATQLGREMIEIVRTDRTNFDLFPPTDAPAGLIDSGPTTRTPLAAAPFDQPVYGLVDDPATAGVTEGIPNVGRFTRNVQVTAINSRFNRIQVRIYWIQNGVEKMVETVAFQRSGS
jgi:type II secretory pathway pseudopilin PulG